MRNLIIDPEFRDKIPPLTADEFAKLEENIIADGEVREPLVLWNNTIIDGHHRWQIIQKHPEIPYKTKQMTFPDKWAAIVWMCRNQLGRRNVSEVQRMELLHQEFEAQTKTIGAPIGNKNAAKQSDENHRIVQRDKNPTRKSVADAHGISEYKVQSAVEFGRGLDAAEAVSPGFKDAVLSGDVKAPKSIISEIRNLPDEKKEKVVEAIKNKAESHELKAIVEDRPTYIPMPNATPIINTEPYNLDDFRAELEAIGRNADACYEQTLVLAHREMLNTAEGREVALDVLSAAHKFIDKYENMIAEVEHDDNI